MSVEAKESFYNAVQKISLLLTRLTAIAFLCSAGRWLYVYLFTDYRNHLVFYYISLSVLAIAFAVALWFRLKIIVALSVAVSCLTLLGVIFMLINGGLENKFLWFSAATLLIYSSVVGLSVWDFWRAK